MRDISGDSLRGHLEKLVLSVLEQEDAHGFEIMRRLEEAGSGAIRLKVGSLYPALYRLEKAGLIRGAWEDSRSERRGPRRRIYALTKNGRRALAQGREDWSRFVKVVGGILGGLA